MKQKLTHGFAGIVLALLVTPVCAQEVTDVHARLRLAENKTKYRIGEPIRLLLELSADREGYTADVTHDSHEPPADTITVFPDTGTYNWLADYMRGSFGYRDYFAMAALKAEPATVEIMLNDSVRFDRAGKYSVKVTTRRVSPTSARNEVRTPFTLTTNEVSFEIDAMIEAAEEEEIKRISGLIDAARGWQEEEAAGRQLSYLTGDVSAREKVRRFVTGDKSSNYQGQIMYGLFISRNRALVLQLLEAAIRDPGKPVTYSLLSIATKLRLMRETAGAPETPLPPRTAMMPNGGDPRSAAIRDAYVTELAAGLDKRSGKSLTTTAMTILMNLPQDSQAAAAFSSQARRVLISQFDSLHPYDQEYLLRMKWDDLRDPALLPVLKKMLGSTGMASKNIHDTALKRLLEIAPEEAKPFVIAEIRDPRSLVDREILGSLPDKILPEVDAALLDQIRQFATTQQIVLRIFLQQKAALAARYASKTIYADLLQIYREAAGKLTTDTRAGFLAYFTRHNEEEGLALLNQTLEILKPGEDFNVLPDFTKLYFSEAVDNVLRERLESAAQETASTAAYLISLHGSARDQKLLEQRLERWRKDWGDRIAEADSNLQGRLESELIGALARGKSWKLPPEQAKELERSCLTKICKQNHRVQ